MATSSVQERFQAAFDAFLEKVKQDRNIIAVYLFGSLVRGDLWEGSDLDVIAVTGDEKCPQTMFVLVEDGITFHCDVMPRSQFRRSHERMLRGSVKHQMYTTGRLVYTTDDSLQDYYQDLAEVGARDYEMLACHNGLIAVAYRHSVRKSLYAHKDPTYLFVWLLTVIRFMANIEVALHREKIQREGLHQALRLNPETFEPILDRLLHGEKNLDSLTEVAGLVDDYLEAHARQIFKPLLGYLQKEGEVRGLSEIYRYLVSRLQMGERSVQLMDTCDWLVDIGILKQFSSPVNLTSKSRVTVDEPAYYYSGE